VKSWIRQRADWLAGRELLLLLLFLAPWLLFPGVSRPLTIGALAVLPLLWLVRFVAGRPLSVHTSLNGPILLLLICLGPAVWVSPRPEASFPQATALLLGVGLFFALVNGDARWRRPDLAGLALAAAGAAVALLALVGANWVEGKIGILDAVTGRLPRLISIDGGLHPNQIGGTLALLLPAVLGFVRLAWLRGRQPLMGHWQAWAWGGGGVALLMLFVLLLTQSRTAMLVTALIALMVAAMNRRSVGVILTAILIVVGLLFIIGLLSGNLTEWMVGTDRFSRQAAGRPDSWLRRLEIWRNALLALRDYPLVGVGLHAFGPVAWLNYNFDVVEPGFTLNHAHNLWLQAAVDFGLMGFVAFIWLTMVLLLLGWAVQRQRESGQRMLLTGIWLGLLAWMGYGALNAISLGSRPAVIVWGMMGFLAANWPGEERNRSPWPALVVGGALVALLGFWLSRSPIWSLNQAANTLDRTLLLDQRNLLPEAQAFLDAAGDLPGVLRRRALAHYESGERIKAITLFRQDEGAELYLASRARLLLAQESPAKAQAFIQMALEVEPNSGRLTCLAGDAYRLDGNVFDALQYYRMTPDRDASFGQDALRLAQCYYQLGLLEMQSGSWASAAESFGAAVALDPAQLSFQAVYGWALFKTSGELSRSIAIEEAVLEMDPGAVPVMLILADMYLAAERPQKGLEWSEEAVAAAPSDPGAWLRMAQAHWALERWEDAQEALAKVLRLDPENVQAIALQEDWESQ